MWLIAASFQVFGVSESAARLVSVLTSLLCASLVGFMALKLWGRRAAMITSLSLLTSLEYFLLSCAVDINMPLTLFITASLVFFWLGHSEERSGYILLSWACMALAALTKGPIGIVLPSGVMFLYLLLSRQFRLFRNTRPILGAALLLAIASPWYILVSLRNPDFFSYFFISQNLMRYAVTEQHTKPFYYLVLVVLVGALPWTFQLPSLIRDLWHSRKERAVLYLVIWFSLIFLFFVPSHSKLATYLLPCFPPLALLFGYSFSGSPRKGGTALYLAVICWVVIGLALVLLPVLMDNALVSFSSRNAAPLSRFGTMAGIIILLGAVLGLHLGRRYDTVLGTAVLGMAVMIVTIVFAPKWDDLRSTKSLIQDLPKTARLYAFRGYYQSSNFYTRARVGLVESKSELGFGIRHNTDKAMVLSLDELVAAMRADRNAYCLTECHEAPGLQSRVPGLSVIKKVGQRCLLHAP
jgi:4-amino-4-deoxy-L-arabinose transferase-like glycosyltransferase